MTTCDDCGEAFPTGDMHHDDSGSYCHDCHSTFVGQEQALYAPLRAVRA